MHKQPFRQIGHRKAEQPAESVILKYSLPDKVYHDCHQQSESHIHQACSVQQRDLGFREQADKTHDIPLYNIWKYVIQCIRKSIRRNPHFFLQSRGDSAVFADKLRDQVSRMLIGRVTEQGRCIGEGLQQGDGKRQCQKTQQI